MDEEQLKKELYEYIQNKDNKFLELQDYNADFIYNSVSKTCLFEKQPLTLENLKGWARYLDSDLHMDFRKGS